MPITLRPRQVKAIEDVRAAYTEGFCAPCLIAPTSFGKTATASVMIQNALAKGKTVWFLAHLREILQATADKLKEEGIPFGWIAAGEQGNRKLPVQLVMVQTLNRRMELYKPPSWLIVDESHLAVSKTYQTIFEWAKAGPKFYVPGSTLLLHLTATPIRLDGRGMGEVSDILIPTCSSLDLVNEGLLAPIRYLRPSAPDLSAVHTKGNDYDSGELGEVMGKPAVTGSAVETYMREGRGRPGLGFAVDLKRANELCELFRSHGIKTIVVSGDDEDDFRKYALKAVQDGRVEFVWSVKLWIAGLDCPPLSYICDMAPTKSLVRYRQGVGRGVRICKGKTDLIYADHANNIEVHGNPLLPVAWSLAGSARVGEAQERAMSIRACPKCFANVPSVRPVCKCGHVFEIKSREIEEREGELEEIMLAAQTETAALAARAAQAHRKDRESLIAHAKRNGYKNAERWADHVLAGRERKKAREEMAKLSVQDVADRLQLPLV